MPKKRKTGLPKSLEEDREILEGQSPEEFVAEFFGSSNKQEPQVGEDGTPLPSLEWLKANYKTKSAAIRYLFHLGHQPLAISKHLGILYQHARNVCLTPLKRGPNEDWRPKKAPVLATPNEYKEFDEGDDDEGEDKG